MKSLDWKSTAVAAVVGLALVWLLMKKTQNPLIIGAATGVGVQIAVRMTGVS